MTMRRTLQIAYILALISGGLFTYVLIRSIGPIREIPMWAGLSQMVFLIVFGFIIGVEYVMPRGIEEK